MITPLTSLFTQPVIGILQRVPHRRDNLHVHVVFSPAFLLCLTVFLPPCLVCLVCLFAHLQASGPSLTTGFNFTGIFPVDGSNKFMVLLYFAEVDPQVKVRNTAKHYPVMRLHTCKRILQLASHHRTCLSDCAETCTCDCPSACVVCLLTSCLPTGWLYLWSVQPYTELHCSECLPSRWCSWHRSHECLPCHACHGRRPVSA